MPKKFNVIEKLDNELIKYIERQGKNALKQTLNALENYIPIRSNLKAMHLTQPNIIALLNNPDLLLAIDVIKEKFYKDCSLPDYTEFTFRFVNDVYRSDRTKLLAKKVEIEKAQYHNELKALPSEKIVEKSYQTIIYNDFAIMLTSSSLTSRQIDTLMTYPHILDSLYDEWISGSYVHTDELVVCLEKCIELQDIYLQGNASSYGVDQGEKAIWDAMYDGDEYRIPLDDEEIDEEFEP